MLFAFYLEKNFIETFAYKYFVIKFVGLQKGTSCNLCIKYLTILHPNYHQLLVEEIEQLNRVAVIIDILYHNLLMSLLYTSLDGREN